jgi:hypothetical protein
MGEILLQKTHLQKQNKKQQVNIQVLELNIKLDTDVFSTFDSST